MADVLRSRSRWDLPRSRSSTSNDEGPAEEVTACLRRPSGWEPGMSLGRADQIPP